MVRPGLARVVFQLDYHLSAQVMDSPDSATAVHISISCAPSFLLALRCVTYPVTAVACKAGATGFESRAG